jgi:hypothetical protein
MPFLSTFETDLSFFLRQKYCVCVLSDVQCMKGESRFKKQLTTREGSYRKVDLVFISQMKYIFHLRVGGQIERG